MPLKLNILAKAPDFSLNDTHGKLLQLSAVTRKRLVVLVLLRGFV
jgi:peroxiredoxin